MLVLLVKLLDPLLLVGAVVGGLASRRWWHVAIVAFAVGVFQEMTLFTMQMTRTFNPFVLVVGVLAAAIWASVVFYFKRQRNRRSGRKDTETSN